jgi:hypothetical protein
MKTNSPVPVVRIVFHALQTLVMTPQEYIDIGKFKGVLKEYRISIAWVKCVEIKTMTALDFANLGEWEG